MTLADRLARARATLLEAGSPAASASLDAEVLARHVLGWDRAEVVARGRDAVPDGFDERYTRLIERRRRHEPIAYITGEREFWGLPFRVTPAVLVPRPETELIVEEALIEFAGAPPATIVDVGTGSGCVATALATEFPTARVVATDISAVALLIARENATANGVGARIEFREADLLEGIDVHPDLIVSNPPYVAARDAAGVHVSVREHEPHVALFGGPDGLDPFRRLFPQAAARMAPGARLIVEVGYDQEDVVGAMAASAGLRLVRARQDLQGIVRTLVFTRP